MQLFLQKLLFFVFVVTLIISCTSAGEITNYRDWQADSGQNALLPERPLPQQINPPTGYRNAINKNTRSDDGSPGTAYWQQFAEYDIDVTLNTGERKITAIVRITYHNNSPNTLRQLHLELVQNLHAEGALRNRLAEITGGIQLNRVTAEGVDLSNESGEQHRYDVQGTRMIVYTPVPLVPGESSELEIECEFRIPQQGAGGRMGYHDDNLFYLGYWYPHMVVYDDVLGWHPDPYRGQAEFYHGFADYQLTIRAPEQWLVMATGELQNADEVLAPDVLQRWAKAKLSDEPKRVYTAGNDQKATISAGIDSAEKSGEKNGKLVWRFYAQNVRDAAFSVTRESHWDAARTSVGDRTGDGKDDFTVINAFWRDQAPLWSEVASYQQHAITFLSGLAGFAYPWPHMTAVEGGGIIGGGMEYPMMTIMGDYNDRGAEALYSVTAHELAHMWIPMIVSTDERRYSWLDEGNTVFNTAEAVMDFHPERRPHLNAQNAYIRAARQGNEGPMMRRSDFHYSVTHFIIASYRKPSAILAALRKLLGEDVFWEAYRTFINEWAFKQAYPWDFFQTFERVSGRNLDWFWHSWYYETWVLNQAVENVVETDEGTRIIIRDEGEIPMPVYLTLTYDGDNQVEHKIPIDRWLIGKRTSEILIPEQNVRRVVIDANRELPDINRQNAVWER